MDLKQFIRDVPDFPKKGILFKDITPLLANARALQFAADGLTEFGKGIKAEAVAAVEARGFIIGAPVALRLGAAFVPLRKKGKLPWKTEFQKFTLEYGEDEIHAHVDGVRKDQRVLVVDDVLATGGTALASCKLVEKIGGKVAGVGFVIELAFLNGRGKLKGYEVKSLIAYP